MRTRDAIVVVLVAVAAAAVWWGDARLTRETLDTPDRSNDFVNITAYQTKLAEPDLYPRDYLFFDPAGAEQYTPSYRILLGWLTALAGDWRDAVVLLSPLLVFVYVLTMTALLRLFTRRLWVALLLAVVSTVPHASLISYWGVGGIETALPRAVFTAFAPLVLWLHVRGAGRWRTAVVVLFLTGVITNLHPVSGAVLAQVLFVERLWACVRRRFPVAALGGMFGAFLVGAAPFVLNFFGQDLQMASGGVPMDPDAFWNALNLRFRRNLLPPRALYVVRFAEAAVPLLLLATMAIRRAGEPERDDRRVSAFRLLVSIVVVVIGGQAVLQLLAAKTGWTLLVIDQLRGLRFLFPVAFMLAAAGSDRLLDLLPRRLRPLLGAVAALLLVPVIRIPELGVTGDHVPMVVRYAAWAASGRLDRYETEMAGRVDPDGVALREAGEWVDANLPPEALLLCEDGRFRLWSRRSAAYAHKDGGTCYYLGKPVFGEWARRTRLLAAARESGRVESWLALAADLGCDHVVIARVDIDGVPENVLDLDAVAYQNQRFVILRASPAGE